MAKRPSDQAPWHACSNACCRAVRCGKGWSAGAGPEVLLWTLLASVVAMVLWRYREWLQVFAGRLRIPKRRAPP